MIAIMTIFTLCLLLLNSQNDFISLLTGNVKIRNCFTPSPSWLVVYSAII